MVKKQLSTENRLQVGRIAVVVLALCATLLAMQPDSKVLDVVSYAWAGLGASIGPAILVSLYWKKMTSSGALTGIVVGGLTVIVWSQLQGGIFDLYALVPGFIFSLVAITLVSILDKKPENQVVASQFNLMEQQVNTATIK